MTDPTADEVVAKITQAELAEIFGPTMPLEAWQIIADPKPGVSLADVRAELHRIASRPPAADAGDVREKVARANASLMHLEVFADGDDLKRVRDAITAIDALSALLSPTFLAENAKNEGLERDDAFIWRWIERGLYDKDISAKEALSLLAHSPLAPWNRGRWDVDHKPYAAKLYADHPKARAIGDK